MERKKVLFTLFISKNPKFSIFYNYSNGHKIHTLSFNDVYIFNDKPVNYQKFLLGTISVSYDELNDLFLIASVEYEEILVFDKIDLANFLEELGFDIFGEKYENEFDEEAKNDILRINIKKSLKIIDNTLNSFSKEDNLIPSLKEKLHPESIPFSKLTQSNLYNKIKRG